MPFGPAGNRASTQPGSAKPLYPAWADRLNSKNCGTWPSKGMSRYQQFIWALTNDDRFQRDVTLGKRIALYKFRGELGMGNFSRVKLAFHQLAHERVAVKIMDKSMMDQKALRMLSREVAALETVRHPAIVRLYEVVETLTKVYLVMEVAPGGEMYTRITNEGKYDEPLAQLLFAQLVSAVEYLHNQGLYHRDIKAENIFLSSPTQLKLGDFGFATMQNQGQQNFLTTFCGSPPYAAPELFQDDSYSGPLVDIWAIGIVLYFMVTATMPFQAQTVAGLKQCIVEGHYAIPAHLSLPCRQLITGILRRKPEERFTLQQIKQSAWLQNQHFPESLTEIQFIPSTNQVEEIPESEKIVRNRLEELGITEEMLIDHVPKGGRSPIIGTYRILMHRQLQESIQDKNQESISNNKESIDNKEESENLPMNRTPANKQKFKQKLTSCLISSSASKNSKISHSKSCTIL